MVTKNRSAVLAEGWREESTGMGIGKLVGGGNVHSVSDCCGDFTGVDFC